MPVAWGIGLFCVLFAVRELRRSARLNAPEPRRLLEELCNELGVTDLSSGEAVRRAAIAELNRRLSDVSFELGLLPARLTALTRISLASGTASALFGYIGSSAATPLERVLGPVACMAGGALSAALVLIIGRAARSRTTQIRERWDRTSRETGKALGTSLELGVGKRAGALSAEPK